MLSTTQSRVGVVDDCWEEGGEVMQRCEVGVTRDGCCSAQKMR